MGAHYSGATNVTLSISNITLLDATSYTVGVTNAVGAFTSSAGILTVFIPPPTFMVSLVGGNAVVLSFSSTNIYDTNNAFTLAGVRPWSKVHTNTPASFTTPGDGTFQVTHATNRQ